jgi:hypothetical protein
MMNQGSGRGPRSSPPSTIGRRIAVTGTWSGTAIIAAPTMVAKTTIVMSASRSGSEFAVM